MDSPCSTSNGSKSFYITSMQVLVMHMTKQCSTGHELVASRVLPKGMPVLGAALWECGGSALDSQPSLGCFKALHHRGK